MLYFVSDRHFVYHFFHIKLREGEME